MKMMLSAADIIKIVITSISFIDFVVFFCLFLGFMFVVPRKADLLSTKIVSCLVVVFFVVFKAMHLPVFVSTVSVIRWRVPYSDILLGVLAWANVVLAAVPLIIAVCCLFYKKPKIEDISGYSVKRVNIVMPIYNENPESLWKAIQSVIKLQYNEKLVHLYLAFDDDARPDAFVYIMKKWGLTDITDEKKITIDESGVFISICRFPHGGKKSAQYGAFKEIEGDNTQTSLKDSLIFLIDSDVVLKRDALLQFTYHMSKYNKNCLTGMISCVTSKNPRFITYYQDVEYISGQVLWRNMENALGSISCAPGCLTILKYTSLKNVSEKYFNSNKFDDVFDYQRFYLGEDRYLTHLLMEAEPWKLGYCEYARCKTDAPDNLTALLKQRRRWYLGHIANDIWMMSSWKMWKTYPILSIFNLLNNTRNTSIYVYLLYFVLLLNKEVSLLLWLLFIILPVITNWLFMIIYAFKIKRKMNILFYIAILALQPIVAMVYMYYTLWTIRQKGWGGERDTKKTQQEMIEVKRDTDIVEVIVVS